MAHKFFLVAAGMLMLALGFALGARSLEAQTVNTISLAAGDNHVQAGVGCVVNRVVIRGNIGGPNMVYDVTPPVPGTSPIVGFVDGRVVLANGETYALGAGEWVLVGNWLTEANLSVAGSPKQSMLAVTVSPNPSRHQIALAYRLPADGQVEITLIDAQGRVIESQNEQEVMAGPHIATFTLDNRVKPLAPGAYFLRVRAGGLIETTKAIVLK